MIHKDNKLGNENKKRKETNLSEKGKNFIKLNSVFLMIAGIFGASGDLFSYIWGIGPFTDTLYNNSFTVGPFEAHVLAIIIGYILFSNSHRPLNMSTQKYWHKISLLVQLCLGVSNLIWFKIFRDTNNIKMGVIITVIHWFFIVGQSIFFFNLNSNSEILDV